MSSTRLFNKNYFIQNILKSKAIMALVIGVIPILNAIFLMALSSSVEGIAVADLNSISTLNIFGMYVLPIVLSLCLFGYVFKQKSVDFINSMPLTRKTIYITNSIGGILLIILMMVINVLLLFLESLIIPNLVVPVSMILDYFIVWTVAYIFVFTAANIATSISGNQITMLVVTAIILFLVPFIHSYVTTFINGNYDMSYYIVENVDVEEVKAEEDGYETSPYIKEYVEKVEDKENYTLPYNYIYRMFNGEIETYNITSIARMLVLSVIYFIIGIFLFEKRKMEVNEISFKNNNVHMILKSLTLIPIGLLAMYIISETSSLMMNLFILGLIIAYCFIYDIITTKNIRNIKLGLLYFIITAFVCVGTHYTLQYISKKNADSGLFKIEEISGVAFYIDEVDYTSKYKDRKMNNVYIQDEEILNLVKTKMSAVQDYEECEMNIHIKLANGNVYRTDIYLSLEEYNKLANTIINNKQYINEYRNIDYPSVQTITVEDITLTGKDMQEAVEKIQNIIQEVNLKDAYKLPKIYTTIDIELYKDHKNISYSIPVNISEELLTEFVTLNNKRTAKNINKKYEISDVRLLNDEDERLYEYEEIYDSESQAYLINYITTNTDEKVDVTKPMLGIQAYIEMDGDNYKNLYYFTNSIEEYISFLDNTIGGDIDE